MNRDRLPVGWLIAVSAPCVAIIGMAVLLVGAASLEPVLPKVTLAAAAHVINGVAAVTVAALLALTLVLARRERRAMAARAKFQAILEDSLDGLVLVNSKRRIVSASRHAGKLFGYDPAELLDKPLEMFLPDRLPELRAARPTNGAAAVPVVGEFLGRRKDDGEIILEITVRPPVPMEDELTTLVLRDITSSKQTREALRAREAHLRLVVEQMPAILWTTDTELHITSSTGAGLAALNLQPSEIIGMSMLESLDRADMESTPISAHLSALRGGSLHYEMEWKERTFQVRVEPLRDSEKRITGTIGILLDITDRKQTVAELKARANQQAAVAALGQQALDGTSPDRLMQTAATVVVETLGVDYFGVFELLPEENAFRLRAGSGWAHTNGKEVRVPGGTESLAGYTLRTSAAVIVDDLGTETRFRPSSLLTTHQVVSGLTTIIPGKERPFGVLGAHTRHPRRFTADDVHFLQAVANILATAIERKQAAEAQGRLVAILEATTDLVAITSMDRRLLYVNQAGRILLGLAPDEDLSRRTLEEHYPPNQRRTMLTKSIDVAMVKGAWSGETSLLDQSGQEVPVSQVILAHRSPQGSFEFLSTIARDIRERRRLEDQFRQAQKMEAVGRLAGGVAHDFNNLLCIISGYTDLLRQVLPRGEQAHAYASEVKHAGDRAASLTRQLLAFSRKQILLPCVLNLNILIAETQDMFRRLMGEDIELVTVLEPDLHAIRADPGQIHQILMNLVVNARDAMPRGGKITISTENVRLDAAYAREHPEVVAGAYVLLRVKDTGCGMDATVRAHLFEPFFTTKEVGKGSGLGLATVFGIVKQSGGHIEVESELECGTTMKLYLPRSEERGHTLETSVPTGEVPAGTETVLLVEDEDGVRSLVRQVLGGCGYQLLEARHGEEALAISSQHDGPIDLVLTDVVMPRLSGVALAKRLEVLRPQTRVLFMSGFTDSALLRHGVHQGDVDCLLKPFTPEALARKVREVLDASLVTTGPNGHSSSRSGDGMERRTFARRAVRGRVILECWKGTVGTGPSFTAILVDISREGAGVAVRVPLEQGQQLEMVLTGPGSEKSSPLRAEVRWVAKVNDLEHRAGLHFDRRLSYDEFQQIVR